MTSTLPDAAQRRSNVFLFFGALIMMLLVGLRYKVGGDWFTYVFMFKHAGAEDLSQALSYGDPGYQLLNWISYQLGAQVWLVNLLSAGIFVWGLFRLCRTQPAPWLAAVIAVPYMVIVVAMGYTRQAVALGILMAGIAAFLRGASLVRFAIYVVFAAFFHKTAVIAFPVVAFATQRNRFTNLMVVGAGGLALYDAFLGDAMDHFVQNYVKTHYSSQGAAIRIAMNMVATAVFVIFSKKLQFSEIERKVWRNFSLASVAALMMLIITPSSTAVDRVSLYLIPLQIGVISRVPLLFDSKPLSTSMTVFYCATVEFVWLNFAQFASAWVPYKFFPL